MDTNTVSITLEKNFLLIPIWSGEKMIRISLSIDGQNVREFDAELATTKEQISFWSFLDITAFQKKDATLKLDGATEEGISLITQADEIPGASEFYNESLRPQFTFLKCLVGTTTRTAWSTMMENGTSTSNITPTAGNGETCTGGTQPVKISFIGNNCLLLSTTNNMAIGPFLVVLWWTRKTLLVGRPAMRRSLSLHGPVPGGGNASPTVRPWSNLYRIRRQPGGTARRA